MSDKYQAVVKNVRVTPRKARLVADLVRNRPVQEALELLSVTHKKTAPVFSKLIGSAVANATNRATVDVDRLVVSEIFVDQGISFKRFIPRAKGSASGIKKRCSHLTVRLREI